MYPKSKEEKFIEYFDERVRWPVEGCPLLEIKMPDEIHNEWLQWADKYREYKDHELAFLKEHFIFKNSLTILTTLFPSMFDLGSLIFF